MFKLYFGRTLDTITTLSVLLLIASGVFIFLRRGTIRHWGLLTIALIFCGLLVCIAAATRDNYHLSVQHMIDGSTPEGLFSAKGVQSIVACILGGIIFLSGIVSIFLGARGKEVLFFVIFGAILCKVLWIEGARLYLYFTAAQSIIR